MELNKRLNIVVPVERADGRGISHVHAMPISRDSFREHFLLISKTFAAIYNQGLGALGGPRVAAMLMRRLAENAVDPQAPADVKLAAGQQVEDLLAEIRRLASVAAPGLNGSAREVVPLEEAVRRGALDPDDVEEVENILVFFTVSSSMQRGEELATVCSMMSRLWDSQTTLLSCTEFIASLPTSTATAPTGAKETPSSIPS